MHPLTSDENRVRRIWQNRRLQCALAAMTVAVGAAQAIGQCASDEMQVEQKLTASDGRTFDSFGLSVAVSAETAIVGASRDSHAAALCGGSAYMFRRNGSTWVEEQMLIASDAAPNELFGSSVAASGDTALVGARRAQCAAGLQCGLAYVFGFNGSAWVEEQKLAPPELRASDEFGTSVSLSGNTALVGADLDDCAAGFDCGSAYVFRFDGTAWVEEQKLLASDATASDEFGTSVSVSGDAALVGASLNDCAAGSNCGAAYAFRYDGTDWTEEQKLVPADAAADDWFGSSVSLSGDTAVVGSPGPRFTLGVRRCGSAYVFRFNGTSWVEEQRLMPSDAAENDWFGLSVSVSGDTIVVGAPLQNCVAGRDCGSAYVFRFNGTSWVEEQELTASDAVVDDQLGISVSVSGETVFAGALFGNCDSDNDCGSAYMFSCASAPTIVSLDIKPGSCPNPVNPKSQGVVPVTIIGSVDFDVAAIDPDSLTLVRADGVGTGVAPIRNRRGPRIAREDVAAPFDGEPCACHDMGADGIADMSLKFSTSEMSRALELNTLSRGETVELLLRGTLQDGSAFEGVDCIVIPGTQRTSSGLRRTGRSK